MLKLNSYVVFYVYLTFHVYLTYSEDSKVFDLDNWQSEGNEHQIDLRSKLHYSILLEDVNF